MLNILSNDVLGSFVDDRLAFFRIKKFKWVKSFIALFRFILFKLILKIFSNRPANCVSEK